MNLAAEDTSMDMLNSELGEPLDGKTLKQCDEIWYSLAGARLGYNR